MIRHVFFAAILVGSAIASLHSTHAQSLEPGAMAGKSYVPSTHTKGCSGFLCDADDPRRQAVTANGAPAPLPPCQGLLCSVTPYAMARPVTSAAEAQQATPVQAAAEPAAAEPTRKKRSARRKKAAKTVAARTRDPASTPATQ